MMAMANVELQSFFTQICKTLSSEETEATIGDCKSVFGTKYEGNLIDILRKLEQDNRISMSNLYILEECLSSSSTSRKSEISKLIKQFQKSNEKQISELKEKENILIRRKFLHDMAETAVRNGHGLLLHGDHGVGKTWLAKDFINERYKGKAKEVDFRDIKDVRVAAVEILRQFGYPVSVKDVNLKIFASHLRKTKEKTILFLDNADSFFVDEESRQNNDYNFSDLIANIVDAGKGRIKMLITSRNKSYDDRICKCIKQQKIGHLEPELAMQLLKNFKMQSMPTEEQLQTAIKLCKNLPLNLTMLGGALQDYGASLTDILQFVQKDTEAIKDLLSKLELNEEKETSIHTESFFNASFNSISDRLQIYAVCTSLFCRSFSISDISSVLDTVNINHLKLSLNALKHAKIIHQTEKITTHGDVSYDMHPIIRQHLKSRKTENHISSFYEEARLKFMKKYRLYFQELANLLDKNYQEAQYLWQEDFSNFEFIFSEHIITGIPLFENYHDLQMASVLLQSMFQRTWRIDFFQRLAKSSCLSGNKLLASLFLCHSAYCKAELNPDDAKNDLKNAKEYLEEVGKKDMETDGVYSMYYAAEGNVDFRVCEKSKKLEYVDNAIEAFSKSCSLREKIYKDKASYGISSSYSGLGSSHNMKSEFVDGQEKNKQLDLALSYFTKSLKTLMKISKSGMHSQMPIVLQNIGTVFQLKEKFKKAEEYFKQAIKSEKKLGIDGFYSTATIMCNLANIYRDLGKHVKALEMAKQAVAIRTELFGDHFKTVQAIYIEAVVLHEQERFIDAIDAYKRAFEINEKLSYDARISMRGDIFTYMVAAYEEAINRKHAYLEDELGLWEMKYQEILKSEGHNLHEDVQSMTDKFDGLDVNASRSDHTRTDFGSARKLMNKDGGMFTFEHLGISLFLPKDALDSSIEIELSEKPNHDASFSLAFGESTLSDVILLGPVDIGLLKPSTLTIPYNLFVKPSMTDVVAKHFVSSSGTWIDLPTNLTEQLVEDGETGTQLAQVEITETGLYIICLVLKTVTFTVDKNTFESYPFGEDIGIKLLFDSGTFGTNPGKCIAKVNIFTDDAKIALRNLGITISPILHVETLSSDVPKKPVRIQLPFESREGEFVLLQGNDHGDFEDITDTSKYILQENRITFQVHHFSLFLWANVQGNLSRLFEYIKTYAYVAFHTVFHLYCEKILIKGRPCVSCCVACSTHQDMEAEKIQYLGSNFELIAKSKSQNGIYNGTQLNIQVLGRMKIDSLDSLFISFIPLESCFTETFRLLEDDEETHAENPKDYLIIKGQDNGIKYGSIPYWKLLEDVGDCETEEDEPPFRFLGLALQNCNLEDARLTNVSSFLKFELHLGLPESVIQDLKAMFSCKGDISIMKIALEKISQLFVKGKLKDNWFDNCFENLDPKHMAEKLSKVWGFLNKPINDLDESVVDRILRYTLSVANIDTVSKVLGIHLDYKYGEIENISREVFDDDDSCSRNCQCNLILRCAIRDQKISCFLEIVKVLLKARNQQEIRKKNLMIFQEILDRLGFSIEDYLNLIEPD